ncbi:hypothetical protein PFISCL1PPCAC_9627, partial [Pristionchus fissidentatus]
MVPDSGPILELFEPRRPGSLHLHYTNAVLDLALSLLLDLLLLRPDFIVREPNLDFLGWSFSLVWIVREHLLLDHVRQQAHLLVAVATDGVHLVLLAARLTRRNVLQGREQSSVGEFACLLLRMTGPVLGHSPQRLHLLHNIGDAPRSERRTGARWRHATRRQRKSGRERRRPGATQRLTNDVVEGGIETSNSTSQ